MTRWGTGVAGVVLLMAAIAAPIPVRSSQVTAIPPQRDPNQPTVRRVPVGTAAISGTVTAADTGRPLRGVRISVNGSTIPPAGITASLPLPAVPAGRGTPAVPGRAGLTGVTMMDGMGGISTSRTAMTDAQGTFVVEHLPAGQYSVIASRNGFLQTAYGQKRPAGPGTTLTLADGRKVTLNLQLIRGGVIAGTIFGEDGDPMPQIQVQAWRLTMNNGVKRMQRQNGASTDDRGMYRIPNLQPGDYFISATSYNYDSMMGDRTLTDTALISQAVASGAIQPPAGPGLPSTVSLPVPPPPQGRTMIDGSPPGFVPVFHPASTDPRLATMVRVAGGDEHPYVDIQLRMIQASNVVGTITNPPGQDLGVQLTLVNDDLFIDTTNSTRAEPNGQFVFRNVMPGKYTIQAEVISSPQPTVVNGVSTQRVGPPPPLEDSQRWWGRDSVTVDGQGIVNSSVTLRAGKSISGVVIFDMQRPPDLTRARLMVSISAAPDRPQMRYSPLPTAQVGPDGRFTLNGVPPGRYQIRAPGGWTRSAMVDGRDAMDFSFDFSSEADLTNVVLTVTDKVTEISGTLTDVTGQPGADSTVLIMSADPEYWTPGSRRISFSRTRADGVYRFANLPAGDYLLTVVTDLEFGQQFDTELLKAVAATASTRVTLVEGQKMQRDLRLSR